MFPSVTGPLPVVSTWRVFHTAVIPHTLLGLLPSLTKIGYMLVIRLHSAELRVLRKRHFNGMGAVRNSSRGFLNHLEWSWKDGIGQSGRSSAY